MLLVSARQRVSSARKGKPVVHHLPFHFFPSRSNLKGTTNAEEAKLGSQVEAGKFDKLKEKQQEAAVELDELKKRREERRKIMEEEEQRKKQEEAERKAREEVSIKYEVLDSVVIRLLLLLDFHWPCISR